MFDDGGADGLEGPVAVHAVARVLRARQRKLGGAGAVDSRAVLVCAGGDLASFAKAGDDMAKLIKAHPFLADEDDERMVGVGFLSQKPAQILPEGGCLE